MPGRSGQAPGLRFAPSSSSTGQGCRLQRWGSKGEVDLCCTVRAQHRLGAVWQDSRMPRCDQHSPVCLLPFFFMGK